MADRENFLYQPIKNMLTYDNIQNITSGQGFDYTIGCLLGYPYLIKYYKLIAIDLRKQQACNANPKAKQQINFAGNLQRAEDAIMFFSIEEAKETIDFSQENMKVSFFFLFFALIYYQCKITQYNTLNVKLSNSQLNK